MQNNDTNNTKKKKKITFYRFAYYIAKQYTRVRDNAIRLLNTQYLRFGREFRLAVISV